MSTALSKAVIVYKLLSRPGKYLRSYAGFYEDDINCLGFRALIYQEDGSIIKAPVGKLFVFDTAGHAYDFFDDDNVSRSGLKGNYEIWKCAAEDVSPMHMVLASWRSLNYERVTDFWKGNWVNMKFEDAEARTGTDFYNLCVKSAPEGTLTCGSLRLLKQVYTLKDGWLS